MALIPVAITNGGQSVIVNLELPKGFDDKVTVNALGIRVSFNVKVGK